MIESTRCGKNSAGASPGWGSWEAGQTSTEGMTFLRRFGGML